MATAAVFDWACAQLEETTSLSDVENAIELCEMLGTRLESQSFSESGNQSAPEPVFRRLGGGD